MPGTLESRTSRILREVVTPKRLLMAGAPLGGLAVFGAGFYEGWLRSNDFGYSVAYAVSHMVPSIVWYRIPPETIAEAIAYSPSILKDLKAEVAAGTISSVQAAREAAVIDNVYALRSGIAGSVVLGYVLSGIHAVRTAGEKMRDRIIKGDQRITVAPESIVFLAGENSTALVPLSASSQPILPILETEKAADNLFNILPPGSRTERPVYVRVPGGRYEDANLVERITFIPTSLLTKDNGDRMLVVVGDGSVHEQEFPFTYEKQQDLDIKELQIATEELVKAGRVAGIDMDQVEVVRIYLGDAYHQAPTGSQEHTISLRQELDKYGSVEVLIDSKGPLFERIKDWLADRKEVIFHTKQHDYFVTTSTLLKEYGITVYDQEDKNIPYGTPVLVYEETTAATVIRAKEIKNTQKYEDVMALTSTVKGHELAVREQIKDICSALVYRDLILEVIQKLKQGQSNHQIQAWLDQRFPNEQLRN